jgi:hypothetical protein
MLPFITTQALAQSRRKQEAGASQSRPTAAKRTRKRLFTRIFEALAGARMRQAEMELARHRRSRDAK